VQHEALGLAVGRDAVAAQRVVGTAERAGDDRLRLAAREQRRAVGSRQQSDFAPDRTDLGRRATVEATPLAERELARPGPDRCPVGCLGCRSLFDRQGLEPACFGGGDRCATRGLIGDPQGLLECRRRRCWKGRRNLGLGHRLFRQPRELAQLGERLPAARDPLGRLADRRERIRLADLERLAFEHHETIGADADRELEIGLLALGRAREREPLSVHTLDAQAASGALRGNRAHVQRRARGEDREALEIAARFGAEDLDLDLHLVAILVGEQRADRAVDQPAAQGLVVEDAALAPAEATRDATGGRELLAILDGQRKEVLARLRCRGGRDRGQYDIVAAACEHGTMGLTRDAARLEGELGACDADRDAMGGWLF
jgi:hypothetical protein